MLTLKGIKKTETTISAKYYIEDKDPHGYLCLNLPDGSVKEHIPASEYYKDYPPIHARKQLMRVASLKDVPNESKTYWY